MIKSNCCSKEDAYRSKLFWNNEIKFKMDRFYITFLISLKYLLGYSLEVFLLAREFEEKPDLNCK